jgi:hypothetical protein
MFASFRESHEILIAYLQKRGGDENSASHCEVLLKKHQDEIRREPPGQVGRVVVFHHENARPRTTRFTRTGIQELQRELLERPTYSPDLASRDFRVLSPLKPTSVAEVTLTTKKLGDRGAKVADATAKRLLCRGFRGVGTAKKQLYRS